MYHTYRWGKQSDLAQFNHANQIITLFKETCSNQPSVVVLISNQNAPTTSPFFDLNALQPIFAIID